MKQKIEKKWECLGCNSLYDETKDAWGCCLVSVFVCPKCGHAYRSEDGAVDCCIDFEHNGISILKIRSAAPELLEALILAKDMFIANDLSLPYTFEVIDAAIAKARGQG